MDITGRIDSVKERFNAYNDWEDKYREIIKLGKELEELPQDQREEKFQVKGCQSQVWLKPEYKSGVIHFQAASDAVLVRGIVSLIVFAFSGSTPDEILATKPDFLKEIGITEHLSMNRTNGLASMIKQVQMYAFVFKSLKDKGVMDADNF